MFLSGSTASRVRSVAIGPAPPPAVRSHSQRPATSKTSNARRTTTAITARRLRGDRAAIASGVGSASEGVVNVTGAAVSRARTAEQRLGLSSGLGLVLLGEMLGELFVRL